MIFLLFFITLILLLINPFFSIIFFFFIPNKYKLIVLIFFSFIFTYQYYQYNKIKEINLVENINVLVLNEINENEYNTSFIGLYNNNKYLITLNKKIKLNYGDYLNLNIKKNEFITNQFHNNSSFNAKQYYAGKNIFKKLTCEYVKTINTYQHLIFKIRNFRHILLNNNKKLQNGSYINALVLGEKDFSFEEETNFSTTGILHILTISGSHLLFLLTFIDIFFVIFKLSSFWNKLFKILFIPFYFLLAGSNLPIFRASCFQLINLFKKINRLKLTNIIAFIIILINPFIIYNYSFILTFIIAYTLILFKPHNILNLNIMLYSILLPITINFCYNINPVSFLLNLIVVPYVSFILLPLSFILCFFKFNFLIIIYDFLINLFNLIINFFSYFNILIGQINFFHLIFIFLFIILFFKYQKKIYFFILIFILGLSPFPIKYNNQVNFIDIGQGDCFLIQSFNQNILIDTGPESSQKELYNYLLSKKINKIDYLFISHFDTDHCGNLFFLTNNFFIKNIISSYLPTTYQSLPIKVINKNSQININNLIFYLYPPITTYLDDNNNSLVILVSGKKNILFTGDIEEERELSLLKEITLPIDILKIAHHGSATSSNYSFLKQINPKLAVLSYGLNNRYHHPSNSCLNNLNSLKIPTYHICIEGELTITI